MAASQSTLLMKHNRMVRRKKRGEKRRIKVWAALILALAIAATVSANYHTGTLRRLDPALGRPPWIDPEGDFDGDNARNRIDPCPFEPDVDGDGLKDGLEILQLSTDPLVANPSVAYAVKSGIDPSLARHLGILDRDGAMSENEKGFIDRLARIASDLIPRDLTIYYIDEEILDLQKKLILSVLEDASVSDCEIEALDALYGERWYVARDVICSGMVNEDALYQNWDGDFKEGEPLTNLAEILEGTDPLNGLEVDPKNLCERRAIIVSRIEFDARYNLYIYHQLKKSGYSDENIVASICFASAREDDLVVYYVDLERTSSGDWIGARDFYGRNLLRDFPVEMDYENITSREFLKAIEDMNLDDNDLGLIVYNGHGPRPRLADGEVTEQQMAWSMSSLSGRVVYMHGACQAEMFLGNPLFPEYLSGRELLFLGAMSEEEEGGAELSFSFLEGLVKGYSVNRAFENARNYVIENFDEHPTRHYFGNDDSWCDAAGFVRNGTDLD